MFTNKAEETISVQYGNTISSISRYCRNCGFDRNNHYPTNLKFALSFGDEIICINCNTAENIVKKDREPESKEVL